MGCLCVACTVHVYVSVKYCLVIFISRCQSVIQSKTISPVPVAYVDTSTAAAIVEDYSPHHSVPSPDFAGLQRPTLSPTVAFTFMRDSQVETAASEFNTCFYMLAQCSTPTLPLASLKARVGCSFDTFGASLILESRAYGY